MRVLIIGSDRHAGAAAERDLRAAGHELLRCAEPDEPPFPCKALTIGCPLDGPGGVDAAVVVREHPWPRPTGFERGVSCAVRAGIPLVVTGRTVLNPYEPWAHRVVHGERGVVDAVEEVVEEE